MIGIYLFIVLRHSKTDSMHHNSPLIVNDGDMAVVESDSEMVKVPSNQLQRLGPANRQNIIYIVSVFPSLFWDVPSVTTVADHVDMKDTKIIKQQLYHINSVKHAVTNIYCIMVWLCPVNLPGAFTRKNNKNKNLSLLFKFNDLQYFNCNGKIMAGWEWGRSRIWALLWTDCVKSFTKIMHRHIIVHMQVNPGAMTDKSKSNYLAHISVN